MTDETSSPSPPSPLPKGEGGEPSAPYARHYDRVRWRCRRGLLELDLILQDFLQRRYPDLTPSEQKLFDKLLATPDNTLLAYLQGSQNPSDNELRQLVSKIRK